MLKPMPNMVAGQLEFSKKYPKCSLCRGKEITLGATIRVLEAYQSPILLAPDRLIALSKLILNGVEILGSMIGLLLQGALELAVTQVTVYVLPLKLIRNG